LPRASEASKGDSDEEPVDELELGEADGGVKGDRCGKHEVDGERRGMSGIGG